MSHPEQTLFCVDDDPVAAAMLKGIFANEYDIEVFSTAEDCLARLKQKQPDVMLLDVDLPGMDGFELCATITSTLPDAPPVIFLSGHTEVEMRLKGYEAGGEAFIHKPITVEEVRSKVRIVLRSLESAAALRQQLADTEQLSALLLSNMDEYAVLIKFMRTLNESPDEESIAQAMLGMLRGFHLKGAVQLRTVDMSLTLSEQGRNRPLEQAIIAHLSSMERIFEFKRQGAYNLPHVTLLVNDMPLEDAELCGRLRDHLAIATEMTDARISMISGERRLQKTEHRIATLPGETRLIIAEYLRQREAARLQGSTAVRHLLEQLSLSFTPLGLSREQEEELVDMVAHKAHAIIDLFEVAEAPIETLAALEHRVTGLLH